MPDAVKDFLWTVAAPWALMGLPGGVIAFCLWWMLSKTEKLLPPQRQRAVPWDLIHLAGVIGLSLGIQFLAEAILVGVFPGTDDEARARRTLWSGLIAPPIQTAACIYFLARTADARLYQIGLTAHRWRADVILGYLAWLVLWPVVNGAYAGAVLLEGETQHFLEKFLQEHPTWTDWLPAVLIAVVVAPITEEILFRGVLQAWLVRNPAVADLILLVGLLSAVAAALGGEAARGPLLFLVTVGSGYVLFERALRHWLPRAGSARAVYATSLLFAAAHFIFWPQPVALFVLALGLGLLAQRTQSLIGPIACHALFNAASIAGLLIKQTATS